MKIGNKQFEKDEFTAYSATMRGMATNDNQDPYDDSINDALDQLGRVYDIIGYPKTSSNSPTSKNKTLAGQIRKMKE
jgi:hypothetical protein